MHQPLGIKGGHFPLLLILQLSKGHQKQKGLSSEYLLLVREKADMCWS